MRGQGALPGGPQPGEQARGPGPLPLRHGLRGGRPLLVGQVMFHKAAFVYVQLVVYWSAGLYAGLNYCQSHVLVCQSHVLVDTLMLTVKLVYKLSNCA